MKLNEMFDDNHEGYIDTESDNTAIKLSDVRKTRLTLRQLNKLRILHDIRNAEKRNKIVDVRIQYGKSTENTGF